MRQVFLVLTMLLLPFAAPAQDNAAPQIQDTIQSQIEAFRADDFATAFSFASPGIQRIFRTPQNFGLMVREGYPMVWRPSEFSFMDLRQERGQTVQRLMIRDGAGRIHVLDYYMIPGENGWFINGVNLVEATVPVA